MKIKKYANAMLNKLEFNSRSLRLYSMPVDIQIEITTKCNLSCPMCERTYWKKGSKYLNKDMNFETFLKVIKNFKNSYAVHLNGIGENLMNKDFIPMLKFLNKNKFFSGFVDNFILMDADNSKKVLETGVNHVVVSFDASNEKIYNKIRVGGNFNKFLNNLRAFIEIRNEGKYKTGVTSNTVINKYNVNDIEKIISLARDIGINDMSFDAIVTYGYNDSMAVDLKEVKKKVIVAKRNNPDIKIKYNVWDSYDISKCGWAWLSTYITYEGFVLPCCFAAQRGEREINMKPAIVGNILKMGFKEIWNNDKYIKLRRCIRDNVQYSICSNCAMFHNGITQGEETKRKV